MPNQIENQRFTCPECGSDRFGSAQGPGGGIWRGYCHGTVHGKKPGEAELNCKFSWPRSEDAKYFKGTGTFSPASAVGQAPASRKP